MKQLEDGQLPITDIMVETLTKLQKRYDKTNTPSDPPVVSDLAKVYASVVTKEFTQEVGPKL